MEKDCEEFVAIVLDELILEGQFKAALKALDIVKPSFERYEEYLDKINLELSKILTSEQS